MRRRHRGMSRLDPAGVGQDHFIPPVSGSEAVAAS